MNAIGDWSRSSLRGLTQRLASSEFHRIRGGTLVPAPRRRAESVAPIRHRTCQWIDDDPRAEGGPAFCDAEVEAGKPYCSVHCCRAYVRQPKDPADE